MSKRIFTLFIFFCLILLVKISNAQVEVTSTGGTTNASYTNLKGAFDAINAGTHTGTITIGISGNTTETASAILNASGSGAASYTAITISPTGGVTRTISGSIAGALIDLNGADNIFIDGLNTGSNSLTIDNTLSAATTSAIRFIADATNNIIQNCTIKSAETSATLGTIFFSTGTVTGNDGNSVLNNTITSSSPGFAANAIYSQGTSAGIDNSGNVVTGNIISDYFNASIVTSGITLGSTGNSAWTITNNKLFQTANRVYTTANTHSGIIISSGSGYTITGNIIGFANAAGTGTTNMIGLTSGALGGTFPTAYTAGGTANATRYVAINCGFTAGGASSDIQGNTIGGFALYTSSNASTANGIWCGISVFSGNANIGTTSANIIGSASGNSSIYTAGTVALATTVGIYVTSTNTVDIQNNTIGGIDAVGTSAIISIGFTGIDVTGTGGVFNIANNNIGNTTTDNIRSGYTLTGANLSNTGTLTSSSGAGSVVFIRSAATGTTLNISGNKLRGFVSSCSAQPVTGITSTGANTISVTINNNSLGTLSPGWFRYAFASSGNLTGISVTGIAAAAALTISSNDFRGIVHSAAGSSNHTYISWNHAATSTDNINNNTFTNLNVNTTGSITFMERAGNMSSPAIENVNNNAVVTAFNKAGAGGTVTFFIANGLSFGGTTMNNNQNNFSNITVTGATAIAGWNNIDGNLTSSAPTKNITNNSFTDITGGTSAIKALSINWTSSTTCTNNNISFIVSYAAITGISIGGSTGSGTHTYSSNNINTLWSMSPGSTVIGITGGTSGTLNISGNTITSLLSDGSSSTIAGIQITGGGTVNVNNNNISSLSGSGLSSPQVNGISVSGGTTVKIFQNKVYDLSETGSISTSSPAVTGLLFSGGSIVTAYNNLIGDLRAASANLTDAIRGIGITSATTSSSYKIYYNTIQINASSSGANFGTSGIFHAANSTSTTATLDLRNNIISNTSTPTGTGLTVAYRRSAGTASMLANYANTSNNNDFYAGTPGSNRLIYYDGTSNAQTISDYKNGIFTAGTIAPRDVLSVSEDPEFQSVTGSSANFLKFKTSSPKQIENGAINVSPITDDYSGTIRQGNPGYAGTGSAPDMGAWELEGTYLDLIAPSISYTNFGNIICPLDRTLSPVTITDLSNVNTSSGTKPRLYFKKLTDANTYAGNTSADNGWKYVEASNASSPFSFTTDYSKLQSPLAGGDIVQYFIVAQDLAATPNVGVNSGAFSASPSSVALTAAAFPIGGTINSYLIITALSGTVNVGPGETYTTLTGTGGLFAAINGTGLSGNLIANITGNISTETGANALNTINYGCAAPYTLTIKPATGVTATVSGSSSSALITLQGADYVTIDGSNNGTSSRDLTIRNTYNGGSNTIYLKSNGAGAGAANNTIKNCNISCGVDQTTNSSNSTVAVNAGSGDADNDNNTIQNNFITKATIAISVNGTSNANPNQNIYITDNIIGPSSFGIDEIGRIGIFIGNITNSLVSGNEIRFVGGTYNYLPSGNGFFRAGILLSGSGDLAISTTVTNSQISENNIHDIIEERSGDVVGIGMAGDGAGNPTNNIVSNNMIYNIRSNSGTPNGNNSSGGIVIKNGNSDKVVFNSIYLSGSIDLLPAELSTRSIAGLRIVSTTVTNLILKNNALHVDISSNNPVLKHYAIITPSSPFSWGTGGCDNNIYYVNPANPQMVLGGIGTSTPYTDISSLTGWRAQFTPNQDANSSGLNPGFVSTTNLHINPAVPTPAESGGASIPGVTVDFDGDLRAATPDIGADEGVFIAMTANDTKALIFSDPSNGGYKQAGIAFSPISFFINIGSATQTSVPVRYRIVGPSPSVTEVYNQTGAITSLNSSETANFTFPSATISVAGTYTIYARTELPGDANSSNDEITGTLNVSSPLCGTYSIGASQPAGFQNLTQALSRLNTLGVTCPVIFELQADYSISGETLPLTINDIPGSSPVNTFTLRPGPGVSASIIGVNHFAIIKLNGAKYITIDGSNNGSTSRNLTIENNVSTAFASAIKFTSLGAGLGASNNTIKNCNISLAGGFNSCINSGPMDYYNSNYSGSQTINNDNNLIQNNYLSKAGFGIYLHSPENNMNTGWVISNNFFGPPSYGPDNISYSAILIRGQQNTIINNNEIRNVGNNIFPYDISGISLGSFYMTGNFSTVKNAVITNNNIHDIISENGASIAGISLSNKASVSGTNNLVANNFISNVRSPLFNGSIGAGIFTIYGDGDKILSNSVSLTGDLDPPGSYYQCSYSGFSGIRVYLGSTNLSIANNNIKVDVNSDITSFKHCAINLPAANFNFGTGGLNYNNYYVNPANTQMAIGMTGTSTYYTTFANWQTLVTTPAHDVNSVNIQPTFISATSLHLSNAAGTNCTLDGKGTPIAGITTDYDGQTRNTVSPDIGADEYSASPSGLAGIAGGGQVCSNVTVDAFGTNYKDGSCKGIVKITPSGASPVSGSINSCVTIDATVQSFGGHAYVQRHFDITPAVNQSTATARITLYVLQSELNTYNSNNGTDPDLPTGPADAVGIANLRILKFSGNGTAPGNYIPGVSSIINPSDVDIIWDATNSWWTISFDVTGFSGFYIQSGAGALPVTLLNFSGYKDGNRNQLQWTTATEINNSGFEVQRSLDGINYSTLAFVNTLAPGGNSNSQLNYAYTDNNVPGNKQYYRLRQVDFDGRSRFSNIVLIKGDKPVTLAIDGLFPNPASNVINVLIASPNKDKVTLAVIDALGRTVTRQTALVETGTNTIAIDISRLTAGTYIVKLICNSNCESVAGKFIKEK